MLDGHNRHDICHAHEVPFEVAYLSLASREDAVEWIIHNQLGRRNLTWEQKSYLRGKRYNEEKKGQGRPEKLADNQLVSGATYERLAKEYGIAPSTIEQKSYVRGKRYNEEKKGQGRPEKLTDYQQVSGATHERLAKEYGLAPRPSCTGG